MQQASSELVARDWLQQLYIVNSDDGKKRVRNIYYISRLFYVLVANSKGMQAVKLRTNKFQQFLNGGAN